MSLTLVVINSLSYAPTFSNSYMHFKIYASMINFTRHFLYQWLVNLLEENMFVVNSTWSTRLVSEEPPHIGPYLLGFAISKPQVSLILEALYMVLRAHLFS